MKNHKHIAIPGGHVTWEGKELPSEEVMSSILSLVEAAKNKVVEESSSMYKHYYSYDGVHWGTHVPKMTPYFCLKVKRYVSGVAASDNCTISPVRQDYLFPDKEFPVPKNIKHSSKDDFLAYFGLENPLTSEYKRSANFIPPAWRGKPKFKKR